MTKAQNRLTSLLHRLGVAGPVCLRAFQGSSAPSNRSSSAKQVRDFLRPARPAKSGRPEERPGPALFTRNNNHRVMSRNAGQARAQGVTTKQSGVAWFKQPLVLTLATLLASVGASAALPATASAYATLEGPPQFSTAPGLPDGREYVQVSPANKDGHQAGASTSIVLSGAENHYGVASADGNTVLFEGSGPMGESPSGDNDWFVATKKTGEPGWNTRSLLPALEPGISGDTVDKLYPSSDLSDALVESSDLLDRGNCLAGSPLLFLTGPDPFVAAPCLAQPEVEHPVVHLERGNAILDGGTPDFSTVYFTYSGTLLPEDSERAPHALPKGESDIVESWGFYENREGVLEEAGVLPNGTLDPFGAVPAASDHSHNPHGNQVSADGSRAFFVSPDPGSCAAYGGQNDCATNPPELYVRETEGEGPAARHKTVLVSQDSLLPQSGGLPASAPGGVSQMPNFTFEYDYLGGLVGSYVFASPDGSQAFFQSASALTKPAEEASPGSEPKTYDFDVNTGTLTYLPGVVLGEILATDSDGSSFAFVRPKPSEESPEPAQLELWNAGPEGGSVTPVMQLPEVAGTDPPSSIVPDAHMSNDGSVLVFQTPSRLSGAFNSGGTEQIYRYDVPAATLGCVSCAPAGVTPRGASMSRLTSIENDAKSNESQLESFEFPKTMVDERGVSADGNRIFFETNAPLVPQDANANSPFIHCKEGTVCPEGRDVYEWENGVVYLISTGRSPLNTYLLDSSENGDDVFIETAEGLVPGDTDGGYDIYDARVPHEGEPYPPAAVPCEGAVCQGPPNVPAPLTPPASATFSGLGNPAPEVTPPPPAKPTTKTVKCKKGFTKKNNKCLKNKKKKKKTKAKKASNDRRVKS
jgi:hypothetical protein